MTFNILSLSIFRKYLFLVCYLWREMVINVFVLFNFFIREQLILTAIKNAIISNKNASKSNKFCVTKGYSIYQNL